MFNYTPPADLLANRVILVTGAGAGIGRAAAQAFAAHGASVILLGRTIRKLESVYDAIEQAGYPCPAIYPLNLEGASPNDYRELIQTLEKEFGRLDGLLHNAAILGTLTPIEQYSIGQWYQVLQVNLNAPFLLTQACLKLLKRAPDASIIFTASGIGTRARAYWGAYAVSKFAVESLAHILADELEVNTQIRVNCVNPGPVRTAMRNSAFPGEDATTLPTPEAIMSAYLYLMGPESRAIKGQMINAQEE